MPLVINYVLRLLMNKSRNDIDINGYYGSPGYYLKGHN